MPATAPGLALDLGSSSLKRLRSDGGAPRAVVDGARGSLRTPAGLVDPGSLAALTQTEPGEPVGGVAVVAAASLNEADRAALRARFEGAAPLEIVPAPVALALAAEPGEDRAVWLVLDAGHSALRAHVVTWHRVGDRTFPRLGATVLEDAALGGLAVDEALAKAAWLPPLAVAAAVAAGNKTPAASPAPVLPAAPELSARGFSEIKELAASFRGPLARRVALASGAVDLEVPGADVKAALADLLARAARAADGLVRLADEAKATRVVAGGGLLELAGYRRALQRKLGSRLTVLEQPLTAAARGALRALETPPAPRTQAPLRLLARRGTGVAAVELAPAGAVLPARFGPFALEVAVTSDPLELLVLEGDLVRTAALPRRAIRSALALEASWTFEHGWRLETKDGAAAALGPAPEDRAKAARDALAFKFEEHAESSPLDVAFVFVATQGEGPILGVAVESVLALAKRATEKAKDVRFAAVATGDHPQGVVRPRYVTLVHPWGDATALEKFARAQQKDPVDGVDAPEALECALARAAELPWRPEATRVLYVLTDVPPHEKGEPPFCSVDWREPLKKLREQTVVLVPVLLEGGALAPEIAKRTRAFLDGIRPEGEPVLSIRGRASEGVLGTVDGHAGRRRLDSRAREVLARVLVTAK